MEYEYSINKVLIDFLMVLQSSNIKKKSGLECSNNKQLTILRIS